jgi:vWA-MoxR associated protein C-terminal domain/Effector-associated domain 1
VSIDWTDNTKRKSFRLALERAYPNPEDLRIFVDEELNENLATIAANNNLTATANGLIQWARKQSRLDEVFEVFCRENPRDSAATELQQKSLVSSTFNFPEEDLNSLFAILTSDDSACLQMAFRQAFQVVHAKKFSEMRPDRPSMNGLDEIQDLLAQYDKPVLVVRFVEATIAELQRFDGDRDLTALQEWRDRIANQFNIPLPDSKPANEIIHHAYLLVTLEESGDDFIIYPELRISGTENPVRFGAYPATCSIDQVADLISEWIHRAEDTLDDTCGAEVTLEIFLPYRNLEEDIARTWIAKTRRGEEISLGMHRRFLVRSSDRIRDRQIQRALAPIWQRLQGFMETGNAHEQFYEHKECVGERGMLCALLKDKDAIGLKLLVQLPSDRSQRENLFKDIIDAAIPIAIWTSETDDIDITTLEAEFSHLLAGSLTNFTDLARCWRQRRIQSDVSKQIKILCDRPDRVPRLPDLINREDDDAIVA